MDRLPAELINNIIVKLNEGPDGYYQRAKLAPLAAISNLWCSIVESYLFRKLYIKSDNWIQFVEFMSRRRRRQILREVTLEIRAKSTGTGEDDWRSLADIVKTIYVELDGWGKDLTVQTLKICFPTHPVINVEYRSREMSLRAGVSYKDLSEYFSEDYAIPVWPTIRHLRFYGYCHRVSTVFFRKLVKACPNLVSWSVDADEIERKHSKVVLEGRNALYNSSNDFPLTLREIELNLEFLNREDQTTTPNNYMINGLDVLSAWIRNISLNLTRLDLKASHLSAELFWPQHDTTEPPHWPNLLEFDVTTSIECAQGQYMLVEVDKTHPHDQFWGQSVESDMDDTVSDFQLGESRYVFNRIRPRRELFDELSMAMVRAMNQMPKLRKLMYRTGGFDTDSNGESSDFGFCCYHDVVGDNAKTSIDWIFACNTAQLLGWNMPNEVLEILYQRWGNGVNIGYITNGEFEGKESWIRNSNTGEEEVEWYLSGFWEDTVHGEYDWM